MKHKDLLWKAALEDLFDDFLRFFYPNADELFDFDRGFEFLDKEIEQLFPPEDDKFAPRFVDKLVKAFTRKNEEEWFLIHIEVQGYTDKDFAKRMFQYYYRILDQYDKPITAFAIFTDGSEKFHPKHYEREYLGTKVYYTFNTFKIAAQDSDQLEESNNPFAIAALTAKLTLPGNKHGDEALFELAYNLAKRLLKKQMPKEKIRKVMNFLRYYIRFENNEMFTKFEQEIAILTKKGVTMGIEEFLLEKAKEEGREEGREEGVKETALKMKKSGLDVALIANITGLSVNEIEML